ncbi:endonuclease/exonuclease/phosphatase family metal-dependent hydrolase [Kribbella amoyensis]|uniref:Endonuclease/exonuclease/phosphatase family metal-dependent hydrolase n=1 Tax=Kribbella amoyensis TaxID=996641 RepID=A0A561BX13_9ACTN|nr:endonuclease/exonuclease/phosphatase family protein [Kribbella amoyensis]TWD83419.1 endonuclease/exonuclease/phosphatase family metal-dependent hydrolase [Kribbella amoyensis]
MTTSPPDSGDAGSGDRPADPLAEGSPDRSLVPEGPTLRVLSYNVHRWGDDRAALARVVRACAAEVALIQEAPTWWGTRRKRRAMAATFGMTYVAASARNAILVAKGTELAAALHWRVWRPFVRRRLNLIATQLPGGAVGGRVTLGGTELALVVCHLGLHIRGRQHELDQVLRGCKSFGLPYLLVGDLNEEPDGPVWKRLADEGLTDLGQDAGPTFSSADPHKRIDGAHLAPGLTGRVVPLDEIEGITQADLAAASDHLPMLIELTTPRTRAADR